VLPVLVREQPVLIIGELSLLRLKIRFRDQHLVVIVEIRIELGGVKGFIYWWLIEEILGHSDQVGVRIVSLQISVCARGIKRGL
jgi:hypothetical protein